jgi:hypothetical protein
VIIGQFNKATYRGIMARFLSKKSVSILAGLIAGCMLLTGCRCAGFYSPVYKQKDVVVLLQDHTEELTRFSVGWLRDHRDDHMKYESCHGDTLIVSRYARNGAAMASLPTALVGVHKRTELQQFAKRFKLEDVSVFRASNGTQSWYLQISFQGGAKWPYGLIYVPEDEPLNILNSSNGGPGTGFSKMFHVQGPWLYFESL